MRLVLPNLSDRSGKVDASKAPDVADLTDAIATVDVAELGERLKSARRAKGLKQAEVADGIISTAYLSRIESGQRRPELKVVRSLAERLGTSPHELLLGLTPKTLSARRVELDWAQLALRTGDPVKALAQTTTLLAELPKDSRLYRHALSTHALALEATGDFDRAAGHLEELVDLGFNGAPVLEALTALSRCYRQAGELGRAIKVGERANQHIADLELEGTPEAVKLTLTIAAAHAESGDMGYAARLCQKALRHAEVLRSPNERAGCYWNASIIESKRGHHGEAVELAQKALFILDEADSARNTSRLRTQLGLLHLRTSPPQVDEAIEALRLAETEMLTSDANPADLATNRLGQARARFLNGDMHRAKTGATACLEVVAASAPLVAAEAHVLLGQIAFKQGDVDTAKDLYREATAALIKTGADRSAAQLWFELGGLLLSVGENDAALSAFQHAGTSTGLRPNPMAVTRDRALAGA